jgi:hypothetical protein
MKDEAVDEECIEAIIDQALQELAREGRIVDSGRRTWSERTDRYEIVWAAALLSA